MQAKTKGRMKTTRFEKSLARGEMPRMIELIDVASHVTRRSDYERLMREVFELHAHRDGRMPVFGGAASSAALSHAPAAGMAAAESAGADCAGAADGAAPDVAQDDDDDGDGDGDPDSDRRRPRSKTHAPKPSSPPPPAALLTIAHTTHYVAAGRSRIYQMAADGQFPKPIKVGRSVRWIRAELDAWIAAQAARREVGVAA